MCMCIHIYIYRYICTYDMFICIYTYLKIYMYLMDIMKTQVWDKDANEDFSLGYLDGAIILSC